MTLMTKCSHSVACDDLFRQYEGSLLLGRLSAPARLRGLLGENCDHLGHIAVGSCLGDAVVGDQSVAGSSVAESPQTRLCIAKHLRSLLFLGRVALRPPGGQHLRDELRQVLMDVKYGTTGDHVESFGGSRSCGKTSCGAAPRPLPGSQASSRLLECSAWVGRVCLSGVISTEIAS
jgi:hypothetical protein